MNSPSQLETAPADGGRVIEIECAGMLIRVSHSIDEDLLRAVLRAVKSC